MTILKRKLEILLTLAVIVMGYQYMNKAESGDVRSPISTVKFSKQMDVYDRAGGMSNQAALEGLAQMEAQKMVSSGDTAVYQEKLIQSGFVF